MGLQDFDFPQRLPTDVGALGTWLLRLVSVLGRLARATVIEDATVTNAETAIAHGLVATPRYVIPVPKAAAVFWVPRAPDSRFVYLQVAGADVDFDVWVVP